MNDRFEFGETSVASGKRAFTGIRVAPLLMGGQLTLPVHLIHGARPGPVLGITGAVHGCEYMSVRTIATLLDAINPGELAGTIIAVPVSNPLAFAARTRTTPERDTDIANLNRVFPGGISAQEHGTDRITGDRGLTERMADALLAEFISRIDYLIDLHHTQEPRANREVQFTPGDDEVAARSFEMARAFGAGILQEHPRGFQPGTITGAAEALGKPSVVAEVGGGGMPAVAERRAVSLCVRGARNICILLDMLDGAVEIPPRQVVVGARATVRPQAAGYLISEYDAEDMLPADPDVVPEIHAGQRLGTVLDPHSLLVVDELVAPTAGYPVVVRQTGLCETGDRGVAIGIADQARWID